MPAWPKTASWTAEAYSAYRGYVRKNGPGLKGRTEDCSKLSILLLVEFAAGQGLPITMQADSGIYYCSMDDKQYPDQFFGDVLSWTSKDEFYDALKRRINAKSLYNKNTVINPSGPQPGDLMLTTGHAALVIDVYPPAVLHPKVNDKTIPDFPGPDVAKTELNQLEYFKSRTLDGTVHFDYLNHRGQGGKEKAELLYYAKVDAMKAYGFEFRMFNDLVKQDRSITAVMEDVAKRAKELDMKMPGSVYKPGPKW
jgi:hypothetical protein